MAQIGCLLAKPCNPCLAHLRALCYCAHVALVSSTSKAGLLPHSPAVGPFLLLSPRTPTRAYPWFYPPSSLHGLICMARAWPQHPDNHVPALSYPAPAFPAPARNLPPCGVRRPGLHSLFPQPPTSLSPSLVTLLQARQNAKLVHLHVPSAQAPTSTSLSPILKPLRMPQASAGQLPPNLSA